MLRYEELNLNWLYDFKEEFNKPCYPGKEGYYNRSPKGPFRLSEDDIRENIKVNKFYPWLKYKNFNTLISGKFQPDWISLCL